MSKDKILDAAEKLFVEKGFDGTSVRALSKEAGVNLAMINYYFGGKENLLEALVDKKTETTRQQLEAFNLLENVSPWEKLKQIVDFYVEIIFNNTPFHQMIHRELNLHLRSNLHGRMLDLVSRNWDEIKKNLAEGVRKKVYRSDIDLEMVTVTVFGIISQTGRMEIFSRISRKEDIEDKESLKARVKDYIKKLLYDHIIIK